MTNKTDKNSNETRSWAEAPSKIEQAPTDTNSLRTYKAILTFTQHNRAEVIIEANSLAEAEEKAEEICPDELGDDDWNPFEGDIHVLSVEPVEGGEDNE